SEYAILGMPAGVSRTTGLAPTLPVLSNVLTTTEVHALSLQRANFRSRLVESRYTMTALPVESSVIETLEPTSPVESIVAKLVSPASTGAAAGGVPAGTSTDSGSAAATIARLAMVRRRRA